MMMMMKMMIPDLFKYRGKFSFSIQFFKKKEEILA